jgi:membrane associated rhomboid family serine protease
LNVEGARAERWAQRAVWLILIVMVVFSLVPALRDRFIFQPAHQAVWEGVLPQLVHFGWAHLGINLLTLALLAWIALALGRARAIPGVLLCCMLTVAWGLTLMPHPLTWYVGLSGALYGLIAWLTLEYARCARLRFLRVAGAALCVVFGLKELLGLWWPMGLGDLMGVPPAPAAHVFGYLGGLAYAVLAAAYRAWCSLRMA